MNMKIKPIEKTDIDKASELIGYIDSGEKSLFLEKIHLESNTDYYKAEMFLENDNIGVFFSFPYYGKLRVHISLKKDSEIYNDIIIKLLKETIKQSSEKSVMVWVRNENRKIINTLKKEFSFNSNTYESIEYIMNRNDFIYKYNNLGITGKPYEESAIDKYLELLDNSMTFTIPPSDYKGSKESYITKFMELNREGYFEAFWDSSKLVGLYWRNNNEIDTMAIAPDCQGKGYGSYILSEVFNKVFIDNNNEFAYLYCVDWNIKGQNFYKKYGMKANAHSYLLTMG